MRLFRRRKRMSSPEAPSTADRYPDFSAATADIVERVQPYTMTSPERIAAVCDAVRFVSRAKIPGAIVECGVWKGGSVLAAVETLLECGISDREIWLYDTFDGMTPPSDADIDFLGRKADQLLDAADRTDSNSVWCRSQLEQVCDLLNSTSYPAQRFHTIVGPVEQTIPLDVPEQIALLRLDTDWYDSTYHELVHLLPRLMPGGVLIIDDYGHWNGCRQAVDEYFERFRVPIFLQRIDYTGRMGVLLNRFESSGQAAAQHKEDEHVLK
jgi:hypothetical protein